MTLTDVASRSARRLLKAIVFLCLGAGAARAESGSFALFAPPSPSLFSLQAMALEPEFSIDLSGPFREAFGGETFASVSSPAAVRIPSRLFDPPTLRLTAGAFLIVPVVGVLSWWRYSHAPFHVTHEGWFGSDTYAGGADKASHFFASYVGGSLLTGAYESLGHSPRESCLLAFGVAAVSGLLVEVGDGTAYYGFSWEDLGMDWLGALTGVGVAAAHIEDLVGFRYGYVGARRPPGAEDNDGATDYSNHIYTADFKFSGALRRLNWRPGAARFLIFSLTYGSKGYRFSSVDLRQRNLGFELGLNMPEILLAVGVRETTWWGKALLTLLQYVRLPFTALGFRYDLNHHRWGGPDAGNRFDPGSTLGP